MAAFGTASESLDAGDRDLPGRDDHQSAASGGERLRVRIGVSAGDGGDGGDLTGLVPWRRPGSNRRPGPTRSCALTSSGSSPAPTVRYRFVRRAGAPAQGADRPVRAWEVDWRTVTTSGQLGLPEPLDGVLATEFVGRDGELARLAANCGNGARRPRPAGHDRRRTRRRQDAVCAGDGATRPRDGGIVLYGAATRSSPTRINLRRSAAALRPPRPAWSCCRRSMRPSSPASSRDPTRCPVSANPPRPTATPSATACSRRSPNGSSSSPRGPGAAHPRRHRHGRRARRWRCCANRQAARRRRRPLRRDLPPQETSMALHDVLAAVHRTRTARSSRSGVRPSTTCSRRLRGPAR